MKISKELIFVPDRLESSSWTGHVPFAAWLIKILKPRTFVELGSHWGTSYFAFCQAVQEAELTTQCAAVDTWQGDAQAGRYSDSVFQNVSAYNARYAAFSKLLRMTFDDALPLYGEETVDLLHIDGLHTYDAVKHDFESWRPKLSGQAMVLFHDIAERKDDFGVWKLWQELSSQYPTFHFTHSHGLGVLFFGKNLNPELKATLLDAPPEEIDLTRIFFAHLGNQLELMLDYKYERKKGVRQLVKRLLQKPLTALERIQGR